MIKSYFITGLRSMIKQRGYTFIKVAGLALGLAASLVIYLLSPKARPSPSATEP
jgi:putative ABC transport system permease protein